MLISIILAAGEGTRMKSKTPKVLHQIMGKSMLSYIIDSVQKIPINRNIIIVGNQSGKLINFFNDKDVEFKIQPIGDNYNYGTGFAVMQAQNDINDEDTVLILNGDTPLIKSNTLKNFIESFEENNSICSIMTCDVENPFGYGRIVKNDIYVDKIVEEKDADTEQSKIKEINTGIYCIKGKNLKESLSKIQTDNSQGELYLTDIIKILNEENKKVNSFKIDNINEVIGINSKDTLAECISIMKSEINKEHMLNGVILIDPSNTYIEENVKIGRDTVIYPGAILRENTVIGENCTIIGNSRIENSKIGNNVIIDNSLIEESKINDNTKIGPFAHLRPNSDIGKNVKIGNFVEVKNSKIGDNTKAAHLAYIGDAEIGENTNIGCGVIFVNYDGKNKYKSIVGNNAFIGSNSNLVAPLKIEDYGYVAAGSTITKNVLNGQLAVERSKQINVDNWVYKKGLKD